MKLAGMHRLLLEGVLVVTSMYIVIVGITYKCFVLNSDRSNVH